MAYDLVMPALSAGMEEGTIARWCKAVGDEVAKGEVIAEIETDKATMEFEVDRDGTVEALLVAEGATVPVNTVIARLAGFGEKMAKATETVAAPVVAAPAPHAEPANSPPRDQAVSSGRQRTNGVLASPLARRIAAQRGVAIDGLAGSGPNGRVVRVDVEQAVAAATTIQSPVQQSATAPLTSSGECFILVAHCDADAVMALCDQLNARGDMFGALSVTDFILKAVALHSDSDLDAAKAIILGTDSADAPSSVLISNADTASLSAIARQRVGEAYDPSARPADFRVFEVGRGFAAVAITSSQMPTLSVAPAARQPIVRDDICVPAWVITLTLCAPANLGSVAHWSRLLMSVAHAVEHPLTLIA